ncbi:hypothetical protein PRNP1_005537 [Phytophthora ramorum]
MPAKKRKSTNQVRREEAVALRRQIRALQDQVQELNARAEAAAMTPSDHLHLLRRSLRTKNALQELIQDQKLVLAGAQSELIDYQEGQVMNPLYSYVHLPKCWMKRRQLLVDMKDDKLNSALPYVLARSQHLNLLTKHSSENRYEDAAGAFCCERFEVNHLVTVKSLREVYNAAKFFLTNVEISTTEALGQITVREDYDTIGDDESIGSFRLISARPTGIVTESNKVLYDKFYEHHELIGGRPCAVMVTDSVDEDELHPYDPKTRVRLDVSATLVMTEVRRNRPGCTKRHEQQLVEGSGAEVDQALTMDVDEESMILIRCASFMKVRRPEFDVPTETLSAVGDGSAGWVKVMLHTIREFVCAL